MINYIELDQSQKMNLYDIELIPDTLQTKRLIAWQEKSVKISPSLKIHPETPTQLTHLSPRLNSKRDYIAKEFILSKESEQKQNISSLMISSPKNAKKFDKKIKKNFKLIWKQAEKPNISPEIIKQDIHEACQIEIETLFNRELDMKLSAAELCITELTRTKQLLSIIQNSGLLVSRIIKRLNVIYNNLANVLRSNNLKTTFTETLYDFLRDLTTADQFDLETKGIYYGKNLSNFLTVIEKVKKNSSIKKIISLGFGDNPKISKEVYTILTLWNNPDTTLFEVLKKNVHELSWNNMEVLTISNIIHKWKQEKTSTHPFEKLTTQELVNEMRTLFSKIFVNRIKIFDLAEEEGNDESNLSFFKRLCQLISTQIKKINLEIDIKKTDANHPYSKKSKVHAIDIEKEIASENKHLETLYNGEESLVIEHEKEVSCFKVLKFASNASWRVANFFIQTLYTHLFSENAVDQLIGLPLKRKANNGSLMECNIYIKSLEFFRVTIKNTYGIYPIVNGLVNGRTIGENKLATITFPWSMDNDVRFWKGEINISDDISIEPNTTDAERREILNRLIHYDASDFTFPSVNVAKLLLGELKDNRKKTD